MRYVEGPAAAVAIDMHRGHLDPTVATLPLDAARSREVIQRSAIFFKALRRLQVPIIHVVTAYRDPAEILSNPFWRAKNDDPTATRRRIARHNIVPSAGTEIIPELLDAAWDRVVATKKRYSAFGGTDLAFVLHTLGVQTLLLAGVNTNSCVLATAIEGCNLDYRVVVVADCADSMDGTEAHNAALLMIRTAFGWVARSEEILAELQEGREVPPDSREREMLPGSEERFAVQR